VIFTAPRGLFHGAVGSPRVGDFNAGSEPEPIQAAAALRRRSAATAIGLENLSMPLGILFRGGIGVIRGPNAMLLGFRFRAPDRPYSLLTSTWR